MNVGELIAKLQKLPQEMQVVVTSSNFEQNHAMKKAERIHTFHGKVESRTFRDAFDYEYYDSDVVVMDFKSDKEHNCVEITE